MRFALHHSDCVVAIISQEGAFSPHVNQEIGLALGMDLMIMPLLEKDAEMPVLLSHMKPIVFYRERRQDALGKVILNIGDLTRLEWLKIKCPFCGEVMTQYMSSQEEVDKALLTGSNLETVCNYGLFGSKAPKSE